MKRMPSYRISMELKYVITGDGEPILFPKSIAHNSFLRHRPKSAGFCHIIDAEGKLNVCCYGESESLKIKSDEGDAAIIYNEIYKEHGY